MDAPALDRAYLERQLERVKRVMTLSYLFTLLAFPLFAYGAATGRFGVVLAGMAWFAISLFQRYRALRLRRRIEARLLELEPR